MRYQIYRQIGEDTYRTIGSSDYKEDAFTRANAAIESYGDTIGLDVWDWFEGDEVKVADYDLDTCEFILTRVGRRWDEAKEESPKKDPSIDVSDYIGLLRHNLPRPESGGSMYFSIQTSTDSGDHEENTSFNRIEEVEEFFSDVLHKAGSDEGAEEMIRTHAPQVVAYEIVGGRKIGHAIFDLENGEWEAFDADAVAPEYSSPARESVPGRTLEFCTEDLPEIDHPWTYKIDVERRDPGRATWSLVRDDMPCDEATDVIDRYVKRDDDVRAILNVLDYSTGERTRVGIWLPGEPDWDLFNVDWENFRGGPEASAPADPGVDYVPTPQHGGKMAFELVISDPLTGDMDSFAMLDTAEEAEREIMRLASSNPRGQYGVLASEEYPDGGAELVAIYNAHEMAWEVA